RSRSKIATSPSAGRRALFPCELAAIAGGEGGSTCGWIAAGGAGSWTFSRTGSDGTTVAGRDGWVFSGTGNVEPTIPGGFTGTAADAAGIIGVSTGGATGSTLGI